MGHFPRLMLLSVLVIATVAAAFYTWRSREALEGFDADEVQEVISDGGKGYDKRLYVMKLFDAVLKRKATPNELEEFVKLGSEEEILKTVIAKYKVASFTDGDTPTTAQAATPATTPIAKPTPTPTPTQKICLDKIQLLASLEEITDKVSSFKTLVNAT